MSVIMSNEMIKYNVNEIFYSIQGEGSRAGLPCVFVRMQGCLLRCTWCDTPYALDRKQTEKLMTIDEILAEVESHNCKFLMLTGGEPLEQKNIDELVKAALNRGMEVVIETNGQQDIGKVSAKAVKILDLKCPGSAMHKKNDYSNIEKLDNKDEVKFVIKNRQDYDWALEKCEEYDLFNRVSEVLMSPVFGEIEPVELANWILEDSLPVRMQMQLHKYIWEPSTRGV